MITTKTVWAEGEEVDVQTVGVEGDVLAVVYLLVFAGAVGEVLLVDAVDVFVSYVFAIEFEVAHAWGGDLKMGVEVVAK